MNTTEVKPELKKILLDYSPGEIRNLKGNLNDILMLLSHGTRATIKSDSFQKTLSEASIAINDLLEELAAQLEDHKKMDEEVIKLLDTTAKGH